MNIPKTSSSVLTRTFVTIVILAFGVVSLLVTVSPVNATTYTYTNTATASSNAAATSFALSQSFNPATHGASTFIMQVYHQGGSGNEITTITDNVGFNSWHKILAQPVTANSGVMEVWYEIINATATTTFTATINFGSSETGIMETGGWINGVMFPWTSTSMAQTDTGTASSGSPTTYTPFSNSVSAPVNSITTFYSMSSVVSTPTVTSIQCNAISPFSPLAGADSQAAVFSKTVRTCNTVDATPSGATLSPLISYTLTVSAGSSAANWGTMTVVWAPSPPASSTTQVQTVGSCPTKNTGTFTMVNNTIYMYYGNALGSEVVNTVQTSVASITGSGSHTLKLLVYVSTGQSASVSTPLVLAYQQSIVISSGTVNNVITFQVNIPLNTAVANPLPFNLWGVGIVGDNKIVLNQSSLSGLFTQTGSASTANQPASFTSQGSSVGTKLYLCATASYQSVLPAVTTTTTQAASTTVTASTTTTATISTIGATLFTTSSNWPVIFLILLLPAGLFLGVTKTIAGAILGLVVGSVIGELMGILPTFVFVGLVISLIAVAFVARNREGG